jgi:5-methylcytosine-specific restriction protein A
MKETLRPCASQPCPELVVRGQGPRCPRHELVHRRHQNESPTRERKLYMSPRWRSVRERKLRDNPACELCLLKQPARYIVATVVDHRIPISQGGAIWDPANHQAVCTSCHNSKTATERRPPRVF